MTDRAPAYILALDLGTTGNRAILFNAEGAIVSQAYKELTQYYPQPGWLEHDPKIRCGQCRRHCKRRGWQLLLSRQLG
jgi:glycerol kinase